MDETYLGGKRKIMPNSVRKELTGRGPVGNTAVAGAKDRTTNQVAAKLATTTDKETLQAFVEDNAHREVTVYTDDATAYESLPFNHDSVKHSQQRYVRGDVHTNGIEFLGSDLKRAHNGTFHKLSPKHLHRDVQQFAGMHNFRELNTINIMGAAVLRADGKRLKYDDLIKVNSIESGARAPAV